MENSRKLSIKSRLLRIGLVAACIALVALLLPREHKLSYELNLNKPWIYGQIIADYDFPIYKNEEGLLRERDSVKLLFQPYFSIDTKVGKTQMTHFANDVENGVIKDITPALAKVISQRLEEIYTMGIINAEEMRALNDSNVSSIRIINGTEARSVSINVIFSTRTAYGFLLDSDTSSTVRQIMATYNLMNYIEPNLTYDHKRSLQTKRDLMDAISPTYGLVQRGQKIIDRGEIVTPAKYDILKSLEKESQQRNMPTGGSWLMLLGQVMLVAIAFTSFFTYLSIFKKNYFRDFRVFAFLLFTITSFCVATTLIPSTSPTLAFLVPFAMVGIFVSIFTDTALAFLAMGTTVIVSALAVSMPFEFVLVNFSAGVASIYAIHDLQQRSQLFQTAVIATFVALLVAFAFDLSQGTELKDLNRTLYIYIMVNGIFLLFTYALLYLIEKAFGFVSSITLIELSNINNPLLRQLSKEASGTFNHSMQVANLASDVAQKIGARTLLVRTGALYHDIGKIKNPPFFTENQSGVNPHDQLTPESSAKIIISHVTEGLKLADKYHIPEPVKAFIATHHGKSKAKFFYITWLNNHPGETPDEAAFTYPGPNPSTREQAILMMADSVEAASRSLKEYSDETISKLVNDIIDEQIKEGYFHDAPITFEDISNAKKIFIENLKTIYHSRIKYPELNAEAAKEVEKRQHNISNFFGNLRRQ